RFHGSGPRRWRRHLGTVSASPIPRRARRRDASRGVVGACRPRTAGPPRERAQPLDRSHGNGQFVQGYGGDFAEPAGAGRLCRGNGFRGRVKTQSTITLSALDGDRSVRHAFFTRRGGVSGGLFASLNCGFGSGDDLDAVARNRAIAAAQLDLAPDRLVSCHQVHGTDVVTVERLWRREDNPRADGTVTKVPGIALGVLAADCAPVLFADPEAGIIGAAHGVWRGILAR